MGVLRFQHFGERVLFNGSGLGVGNPQAALYRYRKMPLQARQDPDWLSRLWRILCRFPHGEAALKNGNEVPKTMR